MLLVLVSGDVRALDAGFGHIEQVYQQVLCIDDGLADLTLQYPALISCNVIIPRDIQVLFE